jgi:hypothetical protein
MERARCVNARADVHAPEEDIPHLARQATCRMPAQPHRPYFQCQYSNARDNGHHHGFSLGIENWRDVDLIELRHGVGASYFMLDSERFAAEGAPRQTALEHHQWGLVRDLGRTRLLTT